MFNWLNKKQPRAWLVKHTAVFEQVSKRMAPVNKTKSQVETVPEEMPQWISIRQNRICGAGNSECTLTKNAEWMW